MKHLFIVNPAAGKRAARTIWSTGSRLPFEGRDYESPIPESAGTPSISPRRPGSRGGPGLRLRWGRHPERGGERRGRL